jgi:ribosomal protein S18 acetylase RimI-like enzyme
MKRIFIILKEQSMSPNALQSDWKIQKAIPLEAEEIAKMHSESFRSTYLIKRDGELTPEEIEHNDFIIHNTMQFMSPERIRSRAKLIAASIDAPNIHFYHIAKREDGQPIGLLYGSKEDVKQEIYALYVDEDYTRVGVGRALVEKYIEWSDPQRPIELGVYKENERAIQFYKKMGFEALNDNRHSHYEFIPETTMIRKGDQQ